MNSSLKLPRLRQAGLVVAVAAVIAAIGASCGNASVAQSASSNRLQVTASTVGPAVPNGFLGLSTEYKGLLTYTGDSTTELDQPFIQLIHNLTPAGKPTAVTTPVLRIGGDSTDWTWWPVSGVNKPGGISFSLTARYLAAAKALIAALHGHYIFGVNFEADSRRIASAEASAIFNNVGRQNVAALELGNEPELYAAFSWYRTASGQHVYGRPKSYTPQAYNSDFASIASSLSGDPIAGPSSGGPEWLADLGAFVRREPHLKLVTIHAYPTKKCGSKLVQATQFFQTSSLQGLANSIGGHVRIASGHHIPLRVDEMNSISCGGQGNLSPAFAPALWAVDFLPRVVRSGATGVNFHSTPNSWQGLIDATHSSKGWSVKVEPEYYGLMMFAQAAPAGARLLHIAGSVKGVDVWAARTPTGRINIILINKTGHQVTVKLGVDGSKGAAGTLTRLRAPGLYAKSGVTLGGQHISGSTGTLTGTSNATIVNPVGGAYSVAVPAYSANQLSLGS